jgi:hypothetical protein
MGWSFIAPNNRSKKGDRSKMKASANHLAVTIHDQSTPAYSEVKNGRPQADR